MQARRWAVRGEQRGEGHEESAGDYMLDHNDDALQSIICTRAYSRI